LNRLCDRQGEVKPSVFAKAAKGMQRKAKCLDVEADTLERLGDTTGLGIDCAEELKEAIGAVCAFLQLVQRGTAGDLDEDGVIAACDSDVDGDHVRDTRDNCRKVCNPSQRDDDRDGIGTACDRCPGTRRDADVDPAGCSSTQRRTAEPEPEDCE
jgi:hypothetical protein